MKMRFLFFCGLLIVSPLWAEDATKEGDGKVFLQEDSSLSIRKYPDDFKKDEGEKAKASGSYELPEADLEREEERVQISKDVYRVVPKDRKVYQVGSNVIRAEDSTLYTERTFETLEKKMTAGFEELKTKMDALEERVEALEKQRAKKTTII